MIATWPEQVDKNSISKRVGAVRDARQELGPPQGRDLQGDDGHQRQVDEPDQTRGSKMQEKLKSVLKIKKLL